MADEASGCLRHGCVPSQSHHQFLNHMCVEHEHPNAYALTHMSTTQCHFCSLASISSTCLRSTQPAAQRSWSRTRNDACVHSATTPAHAVGWRAEANIRITAATEQQQPHRTGSQDREVRCKGGDSWSNDLKDVLGT